MNFLAKHKYEAQIWKLNAVTDEQLNVFTLLQGYSDVIKNSYVAQPHTTISKIYMLLEYILKRNNFLA